MNKKLKSHKKKDSSKACTKEENDILNIHFDPEGKIIFLNETITPSWLISKLTCHVSNIENLKHNLAKCWGLSE